MKMLVIRNFIFITASLFTLRCTRVEASWQKLVQCGGHCFAVDSAYLGHCASISQMECFVDGSCGDAMLDCHCSQNLERLSDCLVLSSQSTCSSDVKSTASREHLELCSQRNSTAINMATVTATLAAPTVAISGVSSTTIPTTALANEILAKNATQSEKPPRKDIPIPSNSTIEAKAKDNSDHHAARGLSKDKKIAIIIGVPLLIVATIVTILEICCLHGLKKRKGDVEEVKSKVHQQQYPWKEPCERLYSIPNSSISIDL